MTENFTNLDRIVEALLARDDNHVVLERGLGLRYTKKSDEYNGQSVLSLSRRNSEPSRQEIEILQNCLRKVANADSRVEGPMKFAGQVGVVPIHYNIYRLIFTKGERHDYNQPTLV